MTTGIAPGVGANLQSAERNQDATIYVGNQALASSLDEEELSDLRDQFHSIDVDKNGSINLEEMRQALVKDLPWKLKESCVQEILQVIDSNTDGLVDFPKFVAATLHVHQLEEHNSEKWQQVSQAAFEKFDVDKDGYITTEEIRLISVVLPEKLQMGKLNVYSWNHLFVSNQLYIA